MSYSNNGDSSDSRFNGERLTIPSGNAAPGTHNVQSHNNDANRTSRSTVNPDGSITTRQEGVSRTDTSHIGRDPAGTFTSMRGPSNFNPVSAEELTPDCVVGIPGIGEMKLKSALAAGFVSKGPDGNYVPGGAPQATEEQLETHPDLQQEAFADKAAEEAFNNLSAGTSRATQIAAVRELSTDGEITENTMAQLATQMGATSPDDAKAHMAPVLEAFQQQADSVVASQGAVPEDVYDWARATMPDKLQKAMHRLGTSRQTGGFAEITRSYTESLDQIDPDMLLNAEFGPGVRVQRVHGGKIVVHTKDGSFPWKSAIRAGVIKLGRR